MSNTSLFLSLDEDSMRSIDRRVVGSTPIGTLGVVFPPSAPMSFTE